MFWFNLLTGRWIRSWFGNCGSHFNGHIQHGPLKSSHLLLKLISQGFFNFPLQNGIWGLGKMLWGSQGQRFQSQYLGSWISQNHIAESCWRLANVLSCLLPVFVENLQKYYLDLALPGNPSPVKWPRFIFFTSCFLFAILRCCSSVKEAQVKHFSLFVTQLSSPFPASLHVGQ